MIKATYTRPLRGAAQGLAPDRYVDQGVKANLSPDLIGKVVRIRPPQDPNDGIKKIESAIPLTSYKIGFPPSSTLYMPTGTGLPAAPTMASVAAISSGRYVPPNEQVMWTPSVTMPLMPTNSNMTKSNGMTTPSNGVRLAPDMSLTPTYASYAPAYTPSPDSIASLPASAGPQAVAPSAPCYSCRPSVMSDEKASTVYTTPAGASNYLDPGAIAPMYASQQSALVANDGDVRVVAPTAPTTKKGFPWWWLLVAGGAVAAVAAVGYSVGKRDEDEE